MQNQMKTTLQSKFYIYQIDIQYIFDHFLKNENKFHCGKVVVKCLFRTMDTNDSDEINVDSSPNGDESIEVIDRG